MHVAQLVDIMEVIQLHTKSFMLDTSGQHCLKILMLMFEIAISAKLRQGNRGRPTYHCN